MCGKWNWLFGLLPIGVIVFCFWFFYHVFNRTMAQCDKEPSVVQFTVVNECSTNAVFHEISKSRVKEITSDVLTNRAEIVEKEHDRFRAELATWLSVFGLLTILVSLITPVCSLVLQQKEFERLQKLIDSQTTSIDWIKDQQKELAKQQEELRKNYEDFTLTAEKVSNEIDSNDANLEETAAAVVEAFTLSEQENSLRDNLNYFKGIWGKDKIEDKIRAGIRLFDICNARIAEALDSGNYDSLRYCLNVMNNANAYLGKNNLAEFRKEFVQRLQTIRPLKHSDEEVKKALQNGHISGPITGFYHSALNLQGGFSG